MSNDVFALTAENTRGIIDASRIFRFRFSTVDYRLTGGVVLHRGRRCYMAVVETSIGF